MRPGRATMVLTVLTAVTMLAGLRTDPAVAAAVRHVATTGVDTGDCVAAPCRTIGYAITQSLSGDTISVAAGTYAERVVIDRSLTLTGAGAASTIVDGGAGGTVVAIGLPSSSLEVTISKLTIQNGQAPNGGGIMSAPGPGFTNTVTITRSTIAANEAVGAIGDDASGGGIYNEAGSTMRVRSSTIRDNSAVVGSCSEAGIGGGIDSAGPLSLDRSIVSGNKATGATGCVDHAGGWASGGAIASTGPLTINRSTISGNEASGGRGSFDCGNLFVGGAANGGAIDAASSLTVVNTTIASNSARGGKGGGTGFTHCLGAAGGNAYGGGIRAESNETLVNSTVAANQAVGGPHGTCWFVCPPDGTGSGGGIDLSSGSVDLTNSIVATNTADAGPDCDGTINSGGHNLLGNSDSCFGFTGTGDLVDIDPVLGPLQDNGGPTQTMALLQGSPAIDAADDEVCAAPPVSGKDQRGVSRPQGPRCDIGAYEKR